MIQAIPDLQASLSACRGMLVDANVLLDVATNARLNLLRAAIEGILGQEGLHPPDAWVQQGNRQGLGASRRISDENRKRGIKTVLRYPVKLSKDANDTILVDVLASRRPILSARIERKHCCALLTPLNRLSCATSTSAARFRCPAPPTEGHSLPYRH